MKRYSYIAVLLLLLVCHSVWAAEDGQSPIGTAFVKAFEANDLEAIMALYAPDARMFPPDAMEAVGKDAIRAGYAGLLETFTVQEMKMTNGKHETVGDLSIASGLFSLVLVPKAGGEPVRMEGRFSDVSRKIGGKWLYIVDHASIPMPPPPPAAK